VSSRLFSIESGSSAQIVAKMLRVLFPDAETVLDMTYGSGKFWTPYTPWQVTGIDLNPARARDVCADFTRLPFADGAFDVAIFDPPYLTEAGKSGLMAMDRQFSSFASVDVGREVVTCGAAEAWRVGRLGCVVKVQNYTHDNRSVRMTRWIEDAMPHEPYGEVHAMTPNKVIHSKWGSQLSVYSVHTTYLAFRHGSQIHARRGPKIVSHDPEQLALSLEPHR
jgi:hypothetical protein